MAAVVHGNAKETGMEKKLIKYPGNTAKRKTLYNVLDIKLNSVLFFFLVAVVFVPYCSLVE